eukprot:1169865-Prorocentrum_minimum.AAC.1
MKQAAAAMGISTPTKDNGKAPARPQQSPPPSAGRSPRSLRHYDSSSSSDEVCNIVVAGLTGVRQHRGAALRTAADEDESTVGQWRVGLDTDILRYGVRKELVGEMNSYLRSDAMA